MDVPVKTRWVVILALVVALAMVVGALLDQSRRARSRAEAEDRDTAERRRCIQSVSRVALALHLNPDDAQGELLALRELAAEQIRTHPGNVQALECAVAVAMVDRDWDHARSLAMAITQALPTSPVSWRYLTTIEQQSGDVFAAIQAQQHVIAAEGHTAWDLQRLGDLYRSLGDCERAMLAYRRALDLEQRSNVKFAETDAERVRRGVAECANRGSDGGSTE